MLILAKHSKDGSRGSATPLIHRRARSKFVPNSKIPQAVYAPKCLEKYGRGEASLKSRLSLLEPLFRATNATSFTARSRRACLKSLRSRSASAKGIEYRY